MNLSNEMIKINQVVKINEIANIKSGKNNWKSYKVEIVWLANVEKIWHEKVEKIHNWTIHTYCLETD